MPPLLPAPRERLTRGLLYRRVSDAAVKWEKSRPTIRAFDPQPGDKGISFFRQELLHADRAVAEAMVLNGHADYGLIAIEAEAFFVAWEQWRTEVEDLQEVIIYYDKTDQPCGEAHYYLVEPNEQEKLTSYIKEVLVEVAWTVKEPPQLRGGKRF